MSITGIIGIVALLWTASGLFGTIRVILNRVFKVRDDISYFKGKIKDVGMIFLVILAFLLSNSSTIVLSLIENINEFILGSAFQFINDTLGFLVPIVLGFIFSFIMFYILFRLIPYGKIHKQVVNVSTWCTTIMYEALKIFYLLYVTTFTNLTAIYGIYAAIVAIILWIYYSSFVFVLGAEIGQLTYERKLKL
jgi:membrane protein